MSTNISITQFQDAIIEALKANFELVTVESYDPNKDLSELAPACLLDVEELPKSMDSGDGRYPVSARFSLHCVLGLEVDDVQIELREFAVSVSQFVFENGIWLSGCVVETPKNIEAYPGNFKKQTDGGYDSWVVSWSQTLFLGASKWTVPEVRNGIRYVINPVNEDSQDEYQPLES